MCYKHRQAAIESFLPTATKSINAYNNQGLANIISWAYVVADVDAPNLFNKDFVKCIEEKDGFDIQHLFQLYQ